MDQDDLTASHWDDVLSPSYTPGTNSYANIPVLSEFGDLDPFREPSHTPPANESDENDLVKQLEREQLHDIRSDHKHQLLGELTHGAEEDPFEQLVNTPQKVKPSEALFNDKDSPIRASTVAPDTLSSPKRIQLKNGKFRVPRPRKYLAKVVAQHLAESSSGLGPLGGDVDDSASAPTKSSTQGTRDQILQEAEAPLYHLPQVTEEERIKSFRTKSEETPAKGEPVPEAEAANQLDVTVGDPMKVGDITSAHIVYSIKTRNKNPSSSAWPHEGEEAVVSRRYKDFRWIYHQLQNNHPGRIIPPPPAKQTYIGRFNEDFIESRRLLLERMLRKISQRPYLADDPDFVMFLSSEDFANQLKEREKLSGSGASLQNDQFLDGLDDAAPVVSDNGAGGFMSLLFSMSTRINEPDEYFSQKKEYIDDLEVNLRSFSRSLELIGTQRQELLQVLDEMALTLDELAQHEISRTTSDLLSAFSEVQLKLKENLDRINLQDQLTLGFTVEEYLRIIGSIKSVFDTRLKIYKQYHTFHTDLQKKQALLDKLNRKNKSAVDKINQLTFEVDKLQQKTQIYEKKFTSISDTIKQEFERFETDKIDDFRNSVEIFIESSIEAQKEAIELYETFYERQNLASV